MIFVTVGTDHHPFERLIKEVDRLKEKEFIQEDVFIQKGSASYTPRSCHYNNIIPFTKLLDKLHKARIAITHGGPGSIMPLLYQGKIPVVVPRQKKFGEAVDDHQVSFARKLEREGRILAVFNIEDLKTKIENYNTLAQNLKMKSPKEQITRFTNYLEKISLKLIKR